MHFGDLKVGDKFYTKFNSDKIYKKIKPEKKASCGCKGHYNAMEINTQKKVTYSDHTKIVKVEDE